MKNLEQVKENMVNECVQKWKWKCINFTKFWQICAVLFLAATKQLYEWFSPSLCLSVRHTFLAATKQLYEWFSPSVHPFVCLSVTPF